MKLEVIETQDRWNEVLKIESLADVYYTYEYCYSSAQLQNGEAKLLYFENELGHVIYPFIQREVQTALKMKVYDIISPYGYGGPLISGYPDVINDFREVFHRYCEQANIVSEVIAFHPLIENALTMEKHCDLQFLRKTTAVDLTEDLETIRQNYSNMNKRNIKKAQRNGLVCQVVEKTPENIETFFHIYNETMNRQQSSEFYYFPMSVIEQQLLGTPISKSHLLFVTYEEQVIAATILFTTAHFAHYHLGGSDAAYLQLRPNNLIFDFMIEFSKREGCSFLHLGGGYEDNDGLFKYKTSFTNNNTFDYYLGKNIINDRTYQQLVKEKKQSIHLTRSYFPQYRNVL